MEWIGRIAVESYEIIANNLWVIRNSLANRSFLESCLVGLAATVDFRPFYGLKLETSNYLKLKNGDLVATVRSHTLEKIDH